VLLLEALASSRNLGPKPPIYITHAVLGLKKGANEIIPGASGRKEKSASSLTLDFNLPRYLHSRHPDAIESRKLRNG
jgi:hypothetical protein